MLTLETAQKEFEPAGVYVNTASIGLPPRRAVEALAKAIDTWRTGRAEAADYDELVGRARRLFAGLVGVTTPALELLDQVGIPAIHRHDLGLANALRERLGLGRGDSAIVTVAARDGLERLRAAGIKASVRAGAIRLSFHLHNAQSDVDAVARALDAGAGQEDHPSTSTRS